MADHPHTKRIDNFSEALSALNSAAKELAKIGVEVTLNIVETSDMYGTRYELVEARLLEIAHEWSM